MNTNETKTAVRDSQVKVDLPVSVERNISCQTIADDMASRISGNLVGFDDLYDPKTGRFLTESELKAKGAVFITISYNKVMVLGKDCVKKSRITKEPTPYIRATKKYQVIANINWASYINKRGNGDFIPAENRANGVENYAECKAIGITRAEKHTINGVAFRMLESTKYFDESGNEYADSKALEAEYLNKQSKESKQKEADKHGIKVEFDPQYRTTRMDSCDYIRAFGFTYKPTENHNN